tara:strand:- start:1928 stop:2254 length:327 start_codon:yes stop_codon:yes gene_type:complete
MTTTLTKNKNVLDYATFEEKHYEPSTYRDFLINEARMAYKAYAEGRILENGFMAGPETVKEYFDESISNFMKGMGGQVWKDDNYEPITDDLMIFVDENNIALEKFYEN